MLVSTHDMETAAQRFELTALLNRRLIAYGEPATVFTQEHLSEAFGGQAIFLGGMVVIDQCCSSVGDGEGPATASRPMGRDDHLAHRPVHASVHAARLLASLIVGVVCSVIGCFVVLRAMAFLGDALAHAILPGVAIAYLLGANLLVGALVAALVVAVGIGLFSRRGGVKEDTAIGILFAAALALGVVLISTVRSYATDLTHILFGNVLGVSTADLWLTGSSRSSCSPC